MKRGRGAWVLLVLLLLRPAAAAQLATDENREALRRGLDALLGGQLDPTQQLAQGASPAATQTSPQSAAPAQSTGFQRNANNLLEFHARNLPVADAFAQLRQLVRRNIVVAPSVSAAFTGDLYDLDTEQVISAICRATKLVARDEGPFIYIEPDQPETRIYELGHTRARDVVELIRPLLSEIGQVSSTIESRQGITSSQEEAGGDDYAAADTVIVRDYTSVLADIDRIIESVDAHPMQVLVEATILSVEMRDGYALGVEMGALLGVDFEDVGATSSDGQSLDFSTGVFSSSDLDDGAGNASTNFFAGLPTGGLTVGYLSNGISAFVKALESVTNTTVLANPKITTLNKQRGEVLLGRRDGFLTTTVTQTSTTQAVEFLETGTRLVFRPFITRDGWVRLEIHPEDSDGGVNSDGLPFSETAEITTNVMVQSAQTVVIGGLFRERAQQTVKKVPLLGDLPWIGRIFRTESSEMVREEIVILLTPHILDGHNDASPRMTPDARARLDTSLMAPQWSHGGATGNAPGAGASGNERQAGWSRETLAALVAAHVGKARQQISVGRYGSAAALLDSLTFAGASEGDVRQLREEIWVGLMPDVSGRDADRQILDLVLRDMR